MISAIGKRKIQRLASQPTVAANCIRRVRASDCVVFGFTLIELLLVLALLAVVTGLTLPSLAGYSRRLERQRETNFVRNSLLQARRQAIEQGTVVQWTAADLSPALPEIMVSTNPDQPIVFYPNGVCSTATVELRDQNQILINTLYCSGAIGGISLVPSS